MRIINYSLVIWFYFVLFVMYHLVFVMKSMFISDYE